MASLAALILAAGQGTRMKSDRIKVLHEVCGRPMLAYTVGVGRKVTGEKPYVVIGYQADLVQEAFGDSVNYVLQEQQLGTGHAVMQAESYLKGKYDEVVVFAGDTPLLSADTLENLVQARREANAGCSVLTVKVSDPTGYGRIIRKPGTNIVSRIIEHRDASPEQRQIAEINSSIYCFDCKKLFEALPALSCANAQGEYYLTDVVEAFSANGVESVVYQTPNPEEGTGINNRKELAEVSGIIRRRILNDLMLSGVTIEDPASTFIDAGVSIGRDTIIRPFTLIRGDTAIGSDCIIGPQSSVLNSRIADDVLIEYSVVEDSVVDSHVEIGPFSHLRPGNTVHSHAKIGNYAELKNSIVGEGSKVPHHSYAGDCTIGKGVNFSAGVITVNYDGRKKHRTIVEDGAFVGCNVNLIAPIKIGRGAYVAAGSTVNTDVPDEALGIARERQVNKEGWALKRRLQGEADSSGHGSTHK